MDKAIDHATFIEMALSTVEVYAPEASSAPPPMPWISAELMEEQESLIAKENIYDH